MDSWKKNYVKGKRKKSKPIAKKLFLRVKQTLCKLEYDKLRITIDRKGNYTYIDLSKRYFKLPDNISSIGIGESTSDKIYLPVHVKEDPKPNIKVTWIGLELLKHRWLFSRDRMDKDR